MKHHKLNLEEAFVDATFKSAKKNFSVAPIRRSKNIKIALLPLI